MKLTGLLRTAAPLLPLSGAFRIPDNLANGVWEFTLVPLLDGAQLVTAQFDIDPWTNFTAKWRDWSLPLPGTELKCKPNRVQKVDLDANHLDLAERQLSNWCERFNPHKHTAVVSIYENTTWFVCNYDMEDKITTQVQHCSRREIRNARINIDDKCGERKAGRLEMPSWQKYYGRGFRPSWICDGLQGPVHRWVDPNDVL